MENSFPRIQRPKIGGWATGTTLQWGTGRRSCSHTYRRVRAWWSGVGRWWTTSRTGYILPPKWAPAVSPRKDMGKPATSETSDSWIPITASARPNKYHCKSIMTNATTLIWSTTKMNGALTSIMGALDVIVTVPRFLLLTIYIFQLIFCNPLLFLTCHVVLIWIKPYKIVVVAVFHVIPRVWPLFFLL